MDSFGLRFVAKPNVRALPWQPCLCCLCLMILWLSCVLTHCFVFVCVYHVFLWSRPLVYPLSCPRFLNCAHLALVFFPPFILCWFPLVFAGLSCAIESVTNLLFYIPVLPCHLVALLQFCAWFYVFWFCLVLFLSNLACFLIIFSLFVYQSCF